MKNLTKIIISLLFVLGSFATIIFQIWQTRIMLVILCLSIFAFGYFIGKGKREIQQPIKDISGIPKEIRDANEQAKYE